MSLFTYLRNFLRNDEQAIQKLAFGFTSVIALFLLNKVEVLLISLLAYIFTTYGFILILLAIIIAASGIFLFQNELLKLAEDAKSINQNIQNGIGALLCFLIVSFVILPMFGTTSPESQLNELKHFDMPQFKIDLTERAYINNNLVTSEHIIDLRKNFNLILKTISKIKVKDETATTDGRLFVEGDIMAVYNYLDRIMPLFLTNQEDILTNQNYSTSKLLVGLVVFCVSVYFAVRALLWQILNELNSQFAKNEPTDQPVPDDCVLEETLVSSSPVNSSPVPAVIEPVYCRDLKEMLIATEPEVLETDELATDENPEQENIREVVVEYCINCESISKQLMEYEQRMDEIEAAFNESKSVAPYQDHNPFKKSAQNLNRGEMTQMSFSGDDDCNAYEFDIENGEKLKNETAPDADQDEYEGSTSFLFLFVF